MCPPPTGFLLMPLPASKLLWEAHDTETWQTEANIGSESNGIYGLMPDGRLMRLVKLSGKEKEPLPEYAYRASLSDEVWIGGENWTDWVAGMDVFGYLIMVATSLV